MNNLPKVVTQQRHGRASNPRLLDRKSDVLPLSHRATALLKINISLYSKVTAVNQLLNIGIVNTECNNSKVQNTIYKLPQFA